MYKFAFILTAFIALSASKTTEQQNAEDRQECRSPGFADGSLVGCMNTAAAARAAGNTGSTMAGVPPSVMPGAAPGMQCSGSDDKASCDASSSPRVQALRNNDLNGERA
ncbi:hypothetical protein ACFWXH_30865 [Mesorhizobium sp. NPDC059054]|uniref:hypothetical protein n=1 Tax=Mesorhizobium sp. NPDC059054 TaxID=3346711 RepID=UPI003679A0F4